MNRLSAASTRRRPLETAKNHLPGNFHARLPIMSRVGIPIALLLTFLPLQITQANRWSDAPLPSHGLTRVIGKTSNGCIAGAQTLPLEGRGYVVMHVERNRYHGHPNLIRTIQSLANQVHEQGLGTLQVGDLGQPRGGPMPSGHRSHQNGLDVDIWFNLDSRLLMRANPLRANLSAPSMLNGHRNGLDQGLWSQQQAQMLKLAAAAPDVDRIFVNPHIKLELCRRTRGDREWLHLLRPWFGHDDHLHLRLRCPAGSPECEPQDPPPVGDGCDSSLDWWLKQPLPPSRPQPVPMQAMPSACAAILNAR